MSRAFTTLMGFGKIVGEVDNRRKASSTDQVNATVSVPDNVSSNQEGAGP